MAIYKHGFGNALNQNTIGERMSNQIILSGANPSVSASKGVFFLELLVVKDTESVDLIDGNTNSIASGVKGTINAEISPIVCEKGLTIDGNIVLAKGYVLNNIFGPLS